MMPGLTFCSAVFDQYALLVDFFQDPFHKNFVFIGRLRFKGPDKQRSVRGNMISFAS